MSERHPDAAFADLWRHWSAIRRTEAEMFCYLENPDENAAYLRIREQRRRLGDEIMGRPPQTIVGTTAQLRIASTIILAGYEADDDLSERMFRSILRHAEKAAGDVLPAWTPDTDAKLFG